MNKALIIHLILSMVLMVTAQELKPPVLESKNEVILMPTIHSGHKKEGEFYNLERLASAVSKVRPDIICTEITPKSFGKVQAGKRDKRLSFLPEYTEVILKLQKKLNYEIIPCSAWTAKLNYKTVGLKAMDNAHYELIAKALDTYTNQQKRILITFGSGHMDGLLEHLRKRQDIHIVDYRIELKKQKEAYLKSQ